MRSVLADEDSEVAHRSTESSDRPGREWQQVKRGMGNRIWGAHRRHFWEAHRSRVGIKSMK